MIFPPEIWEHIFTHADPVALIKLKTVCKCWNVLIEKIVQNHVLWYKRCKEDIPDHLWGIYCEKINPNKYHTDFHETMDADIWMTMYKLWMRNKNLLKCELLGSCVRPWFKRGIEETVTCMTVSGDFLAVGTTEGYIYFYSICRSQLYPIYAADHKDHILDVQFIRYGVNIVAVSCSVNKHVMFWDVRAKRLLDKRRGTLICTSYNHSYYAIDNVVIVQDWIPGTSHQIDTGNIKAIGADYNKVSYYTDEGYYTKWNLGIDDPNVTSEFVKFPDIKIRNYYIFKPDISVCVTDDGYLAFLKSNKDWEIHNIFPFLHGIPTTVLVYGNLLVLGLDSGNVHIYCINNFDEMDFSTADSKMICLNQTPVISLDIFVETEEYLMVAYRRKIYIVKFI